eukprot:10362425-Lingulodinium_polyedra.AAC.1
MGARAARRPRCWVCCGGARSQPGDEPGDDVRLPLPAPGPADGNPSGAQTARTDAGASLRRGG